MRSGFFVLLVTLAALRPLAAQELKLIPEPRQVERRQGSFTVTPATRIVLGSRHAREDRTAAETLADEIESALGKRPAIVTSATLPPGRVIYLARAGDDRALAARLKRGNLAIANDFDEQGYILEASSSRILISARTGQGLFYGAQTLCQLLLPSEKRLSVPAVAIRDWPAMKWRGVHDDVSRGPVPTLAYMKQQVRTLAHFKINLFSLYMEHVFAYRSQPVASPAAGGAITADEIRELVEHAAKYYVTILPEQQAFGHLHHVLKYEQYQDIAETPHGHVLTPTKAQTYDFIRSLYTELAPLFPGPLFHIGSDETFELGRGQTREPAERVGLGRVYLEHLQKVFEIMKPYNKRLMFWADIAEKYPELLGILPKDMIANAWEYDAEPDFTRKIKPFRDAGLDVFVSPGSSSWIHIWPDFSVAFVNVRNFVRDGQKLGAIGMLNTTWDDDGEALFGFTWPSLVLGAACSWQAGECSIERFLASYDWAFFRNPQDNSFRDAVLALNQTHMILKGAGVGAAINAPFWLDPFSEAGARYAGRVLPVARDVRLSAERALELVERNRRKARANGEVLDYMAFAARRIDMLGMKVQFADEMARYYQDSYENLNDPGRVGRNRVEISSTNGRLEDLRDSTTELRRMYADLWNKENRTYWLTNVLVRYDNLAEVFDRKIRQMDVVRAQYGMTRTMPTPAEMGFLAPIAPASRPVQAPTQPTTPPTQTPPAANVSPPIPK